MFSRTEKNLDTAGKFSNHDDRDFPIDFLTLPTWPRFCHAARSCDRCGCAGNGICSPSPLCPLVWPIAFRETELCLERLEVGAKYRWKTNVWK